MFSDIGAHPEIVAAFLSAIATVFSAIATGLAVWAAIQGPKSAARLAEQLRRDTEGRTERRRLKFHIFSTLIEERAYIASSAAVRMLNSIDIAFHDARAVRDAWADLYAAFNAQPSVPQHVIHERLKKLLTEMAADLDLSSDLRSSDFDRIYYPTAIAQERYIQDVQREQQMRTLMGRTSQNASPNSGPFPPPPE